MSIVGELSAIAAREEWMRDAVCAQIGHWDIWHPEKGNSGAEAKRVCFTCPVRVECLEHALKHREAGIWGGFNERDRERLNRGINPHRGPGRPPRRENGHGYACKCAVCRRSA